MKLKQLVALEPSAKDHPLYQKMADYGWLIVRLVPLFGTDRIIIADADAGHALGICVTNNKEGEELRRHAMWLEKGKFSLNALPESKRDTLVRHFIQDCKFALWERV